MTTKEVLRLLSELRYHQIMRRVDRRALRAAEKKVCEIIQKIKAERANAQSRGRVKRSPHIS